MIKRALFDTREAADRAATEGLERLVARLTDRAREALPPELRGNLGPVPVVSARLLSIAPLPLSAIAGSADPHVLATVELVDAEGRAEELTLHLRAAEVPPAPHARGVLRVQATKRSRVRLRATLPDRVQITTFAPATVTAGNRLQDTATGKMYRASASVTIAAAGKWPVDVVEVSSSEPGETSPGAALTWLVPPTNVMPQAAVLRMTSVEVAFGATLVDRATGSRYMIVSSGWTPSDEKLAGAAELDVEVSRIGGPSAAPFSSLELEAAIAGLASKATLLSTVEVKVPKGSHLRNPLTTRAYRTALELVLKDDGAGAVGIEAVDAEPASDLLGGEWLEFDPAPTDVDTNAFVTEAVPAETFPLSLAAAVIGAPLDFDAIVQREPDGRWSANVGTRPLGT